VIGRVEPVMGTVASLTVDPGERSTTAARSAIAAACRILHEADATFSTFDPGSPLSRHRRGERRAEELPGELLDVLERSAAARRLTGGAFDPWAMPGGFDPTGLVKGWAAQRALGPLRDSGMAGAMVNAGGDIACFGDGGWRIGVRDPFAADRLICVADVRSAVATSGGYERPGEIRDPGDGRPGGQLVQATVSGPDLALADAYATALVVVGEAGLELLQGTAYEAVIVTPDRRMLRTAGFPVAGAAAAA
jgi:thiamine biosynthesis lipoprotein